MPKKRKKAEDKNICITVVRGVKKYLANITLPNKKRKKAYFDNKDDARAWVKEMRKNIGIDLSDLAALSQNQLADIRLAIKNLPCGASLSKCVEIFNQKFATTKSLTDCIDEFNGMKTAAELDAVYSRILKARVSTLSEFKTFENISGRAIIAKVTGMKKPNGVVFAPKTKMHYLGAYREFFDWCVTRGYIKESPFNHIHEADIPRVKRKFLPVPNIADVQSFFRIAEVKYPQFVGIVALVAFGGLRKSEASKLTPVDIDVANKRITLSFEKSKTGRNFLQEKMPDNIWAWLVRYPPNAQWLKFLDKNFYNRMNEEKLIPKNGLRHAFATYHLSLYRDAPRTQILMRHENPRRLWENYLSSLVSDTEAAEYFKILPNQLS